MSEPNGNGRPRIDWQTIGIVIATWVIGGMLAWGTANARLAVLEDRNLRIQDELGEMKRDLREVRDSLRRSNP